MSQNRANLLYQLQHAARNPSKITPHLRRLGRNAILRLRTRGDHVAYYRQVMRSNVGRSAETAVGSHTHDRWLALGQLQFDYLKDHGLSPGHRFLEIGCGNLRAGRLIIDYLEPGHYYGLDISPDILIAAQQTIRTYDLQDKVPHLTPVRDLKLEFLPAGHFDVVHAHSVFSHSPLGVIEECFGHIGRVLAPAGFFDFTFDRTEGQEHQVLREDFYYRTETLTRLAARHDLDATFMSDWERLPHGQSKIRLRLAGHTRP